MFFFVILFFFLLAYKIKITKNSFFDSLSFDQSNAIKGCFILLVFLRHILQYTEKAQVHFVSTASQFVISANNQLGQLIVTMFLFYSGYGVMESIKRKKMAYVTAMPQKRILPTIINFDIAVLVFAFIRFLFQTTPTIPKLCGSLIGWDSIGNSNWYIFDIIVCYTLMFVIFRLFYNPKNAKPTLALIFIFLGTIVAIFVLSRYKPSRWYNTLLTFPFGVYFSVYKDELFSFFKKYFYQSFAITLSIVALLKVTPHDILCIKYNILSISFALFIVLFTMKIKIENGILIWFGKHLFPLYIYQRVPMIILSRVGSGKFVHDYPYLYICSCFAITLIIAFLYKYWQFPFKKKST